MRTYLTCLPLALAAGLTLAAPARAVSITLPIDLNAVVTTILGTVTINVPGGTPIILIPTLTCTGTVQYNSTPGINNFEPRDINYVGSQNFVSCTQLLPLLDFPKITSGIGIDIGTGENLTCTSGEQVGIGQNTWNTGTTSTIEVDTDIFYGPLPSGQLIGIYQGQVTSGKFAGMNYIEVIPEINSDLAACNTEEGVTQTNGAMQMFIY